ncbi:MAG: MerR family DNA-binding transcriptional regulator [Acidimicrobiia bacterium]
MPALRHGEDDEGDGELISIGRLAAETGVSNRTIRYYEDLGILPEPPRSAGGTRKYPREYRFYIEGALALKELGFTLEEIRLIGRMALSGTTDDEQRLRAAQIVADRVESLERKIDVLSRLRDVLNDYGSEPSGSRLEDIVNMLHEQATPSTPRP